MQTWTDIARRRGEITAELLALGAPLRSEHDALAAVRRRLSPEAVQRLKDLGLGKRLTTLVIPQRTLDHRRQKGEKLTVEESDRAYRVAAVVGLAEAVFADRAKALRWLTTAKARFGGEAPLDLLDTSAGAALIEEALLQIDEGYFA